MDLCRKCTCNLPFMRPDTITRWGIWILRQNWIKHIELWNPKFLVKLPSLPNTAFFLFMYIPYYSSEIFFENSMCSRIIKNQISHTSATSAQRNSSKKSTSQITKWDFINWKKTICVLNVVRCFWLLEHWKNIWKLNILTHKFMSVMFVRKSSKERTN